MGPAGALSVGTVGRVLVGFIAVGVAESGANTAAETAGCNGSEAAKSSRLSKPMGELRANGCEEFAAEGIDDVIVDRNANESTNSKDDAEALVALE